MGFVIDASIAVKMLVDEVQSDKARELLARATALHAPRLLASEVANALWRKVRLRELDLATVNMVVNGFGELPLRWYADETIVADAVRLAIAIDHPLYDCLYLALAYRIRETMVTADQRFINAVAQTDHESMVLTLTNYTEAL